MAQRPGLRDAAAAFRHRDFAIFWTGAVFSNTGTWIQRATVPFVLFEMTGSATWVGFAAFASLIPAVVMGPLAGVIADRYPRRRVLLISQSVMALIDFALYLTFVFDAASPWVLIAFTASIGVVGGLNIPSWQAFVSELVPREQLLNAVTLNSAQFNASSALGPALAGVILATWGADAAFLINALSFGAVIVALMLVRDSRASVSSPPSGKVLSQFAETVRYVRARPGMATCVHLVVLLGLLGSPVFQLIKVFTDEVFHVGPVAFGLLGASLGIGSVIGAPIVAGPGSALPRSRLTGGGIVVYGLSLTAFALAPVYGVALVALLIAGGAYLAVASSLNTTLQTQVDEAIRGRAMGVYLMSFTLAIPLGALAQGWLADVVGPRPTVAVAGALFSASALVMGAWGRLTAMDDDGPPARAAAADPVTPAGPAVGA
ncbi:MAG TPA: MFS transporter [Acidimicrobiia bacterium]|nr:MFS transporter [Acidimicrobiia bacterium]